MKKLLISILIITSLQAYSQQIIRGYTASFAYGFLSVGNDFNIHYSGNDYIASARDGSGSCLSLGFPFDVGFKRSRLVFTPGLDFLSVGYELDLDNDIPGFGADSDSLKLSAFVIMPKLEVLYKYHFYVKSMHFSIGGGIDIRLPISNAITLLDKDKSDLIEYDDNPKPGDDYMVFNPKTVYSELENLGLHVSPKICFDIYVTRFLVTNIFYTTSPLTTCTDEPALRGFGGIGASYLIPAGKKDDSRLLQYYKQ